MNTNVVPFVKKEEHLPGDPTTSSCSCRLGVWRPPSRSSFDVMRAACSASAPSRSAIGGPERRWRRRSGCRSGTTAASTDRTASSSSGCLRLRATAFGTCAATRRDDQRGRLTATLPQSFLRPLTFRRASSTTSSPPSGEVALIVRSRVCPRIYAKRSYSALPRSFHTRRSRESSTPMNRPHDPVCSTVFANFDAASRVTHETPHGRTALLTR